MEKKQETIGAMLDKLIDNPRIESIAKQQQEQLTVVVSDQVPVHAALDQGIVNPSPSNSPPNSARC